MNKFEHVFGPEAGSLLWLVHIALDRDWDREQETMGFHITLCTVHTTQGQ